MTNAIREVVELHAPTECIWRALTDANKFGAWFKVSLDGPFVLGSPTRGRVTLPGFEHVGWNATTVAMEPERLFAFTWHPYAVDPAINYDAEVPTRVEFRLNPVGAGTVLTILESGFDALPAVRRDVALRMHEQGWRAQAGNIKAYVEA